MYTQTSEGVCLDSGGGISSVRGCTCSQSLFEHPRRASRGVELVISVVDRRYAMGNTYTHGVQGRRIPFGRKIFSRNVARSSWGARAAGLGETGPILSCFKFRKRRVIVAAKTAQN